MFKCNGGGVHRCCDHQEDTQAACVLRVASEGTEAWAEHMGSASGAPLS